MANIEAFKSKIRGGVRPNQFRVTIDPVGVIGSDLNDVQYFAYATTLPGSSIGQAQTFYRGRMIPLAGERNFNPWTVQFYTDQDMQIRTAMEQWSNYINDYVNNAGETNPSLYKSSAYVTQMDRADQDIKKYHIKGIFPIDISEMQVSWQANDQVSEFSVTFAVESVDPFFG
jgi:hypothetical protein